jgi:hypothetical protein
MVVNNFFKICLISIVFTFSSPVFADTYGEGAYGSERYSGNNSTTTAPGAPTSVIATAGNGQARISFTPPGNNGGATITSYVVTSSPGDISVAGSNSPIVVTGLSNGTAYTFTVVAINSVGTSTPSATSTSVTPSVPAVTQVSNYGGGGSTSGSSYIPTSLINKLNTDLSPKPIIDNVINQITQNVQSGVSNFNTNLVVGAIDKEIKTLQQFLNKKGFIISTTGPGSIGNETMKFGPATKAALIKFQKANNISPATGFFGPITRALVNSMLDLKTTDTSTSTKTAIVSESGSSIYTRDLDINMSGADVKALQQFLNKKGFIVSKVGPGSVGNETELFGPATKAALIKFQKANNISPAMGYFGSLTREFVTK